MMKNKITRKSNIKDQNQFQIQVYQENLLLNGEKVIEIFIEKAKKILLREILRKNSKMKLIIP